MKSTTELPDSSALSGPSGVRDDILSRDPHRSLSDRCFIEIVKVCVALGRNKEDLGASACNAAALEPG